MYTELLLPPPPPPNPLGLISAVWLQLLSHTLLTIEIYYLVMNKNIINMQIGKFAAHTINIEFFSCPETVYCICAEKAGGGGINRLLIYLWKTLFVLQLNPNLKLRLWISW
jgi:hypothetical protein